MAESTNVNTTEIAENTSKNTAKVISIINMKGGVGKTTLTINLAISLADKNKRVLVIDLDPQFNSTQSLIEYKLGLETNGQNTKSTGNITQTDLLSSLEDPTPGQSEQREIKNSFEFYTQLSEDGNTAYSLFENKNLKNSNHLITRITDYLDLIPGDLKLSSSLSGDVYGKLSALQIFFTKQNITEKYDYVLIDNAPTWSEAMTLSGLKVADYYLVPTKLEFYSSLGIKLLEEQFADYKTTQELDKLPYPAPLGLVAMFTNDGNSSEREIKDTIADEFESLDFFQTKIPDFTSAGSRFTIYKKMATNGKYNSLISQFSKLVQEFETRINKMESENAK